jgi:two-component system response regulator DesR
VIRVGLVEDHVALGDGLAVLLDGEPDIAVAWVDRDAASIARRLQTDPPDVVLCDVMLHGRHAGLDIVARFKSRTRFIVFSAFDFPAHHLRAVDEGAAGFVSKAAPLEDIVAAIRTVHAGGRSFPASVLRSARTAPRPPTERELELLSVLAEGASNEELASRLSVSEKTVEGWIRRLFDRYACTNRTQLARFAMGQGWLTGSPPRRR